MATASPKRKRGRPVTVLRPTKELSKACEELRQCARDVMIAEIHLARKREARKLQLLRVRRMRDARGRAVPRSHLAEIMGCSVQRVTQMLTGTSEQLLRDDD